MIQTVEEFVLYFILAPVPSSLTPIGGNFRNAHHSNKERISVINSFPPIFELTNP
jgi:hypothetical protein